MPAESERLRRRVQTRDRLFIVIAAVAAAALPAAFVLAGHGRHALRPNCTTTIVAGFMGGETHTVCTSRP
jgi:hypothetical protein